jgi:predicted DNA-binding transcriptional regulator AlpA
MESSLVDAKKLAAMLGQAKSSVYRLAKMGVLPCYKAGPRQRGIRFDVAECRAALRRQATQNQEVHR